MFMCILTTLVESQHIDHGTHTWAFAHVVPRASIGKNSNTGDHCFTESSASIGNNATTKNGNAIWDGVTPEDGAFVGLHVFYR